MKAAIPWLLLALGSLQLLNFVERPPPGPCRSSVSRLGAFSASVDEKNLDELLWALQRGDEALAMELLKSPRAPELLKRRSRRHDCTCLMLAAGASGRPASDVLVERILSFGAAANVAARSRSHRTAADYAALHPTCEHLSPRLRALALEAVQSASGRCPCCGQQLMRRPRIASLADRYLRGEHENQLLERFFSEEITAKTENGSSATWDTLMRPEFHTFHKSRTFHKELSESLAVLEEIQISCPQILEDAEHWHFLDLCCGKSLTSLVLSTRCPDLTVSALDRVGPEGIPHYKEAGLSVKYLQQDLLDSASLPRLASHLRRRTTAMVGLHLCGNLSVRAVELFEELESIRICILVPCCLPHLRDAPNSLKHLYRQSVADDLQYAKWVSYLEERLAAIPNVAMVRQRSAVHMKSKKNTILTAIKRDA